MRLVRTLRTQVSVRIGVSTYVRMYVWTFQGLAEAEKNVSGSLDIPIVACLFALYRYPIKKAVSLVFHPLQDGLCNTNRQKPN